MRNLKLLIAFLGLPLLAAHAETYDLAQAKVLHEAGRRHGADLQITSVCTHSVLADGLLTPTSKMILTAYTLKEIPLQGVYDVSDITLSYAAPSTFSENVSHRIDGGGVWLGENTYSPTDRFNHGFEAVVALVRAAGHHPGAFERFCLNASSGAFEGAAWAMSYRLDAGARESAYVSDQTGKVLFSNDAEF